MLVIVAKNLPAVALMLDLPTTHCDFWLVFESPLGRSSTSLRTTRKSERTMNWARAWPTVFMSQLILLPPGDSWTYSSASTTLKRALRRKYGTQRNSKLQEWSRVSEKMKKCFLARSYASRFKLRFSQI